MNMTIDPAASMVRHSVTFAVQQLRAKVVFARGVYFCAGAGIQ
jgi:hypothetical protein